MAGLLGFAVVCRGRVATSDGGTESRQPGIERWGIVCVASS